MGYAIAVGAALAFLFFWQFNALVGLRNLVRNAWADVDVYLKRRAELIPNLVESVRAYASHEQSVLEATAEARSRALVLQGPTGDRAAAEAQLGQAAHRVLLLAEQYPDLRAGENFRQLQHALAETEKTIASARQYYNACVRDFNTKIESFPSSLVAATMGLRPQEYFELDDPLEREAPSAS